MTLRLFEGYGIEIEYMIVERETLRVLPVADRVLQAVAGEIVSDVETGELAWSNELVLHLVELKTNGPAPTLEDLPAAFERDVRRIDEILAPMGGRLLGTAMHPFMNPDTDTRLWPHEASEIYETYDRIFGCQGHGWSNLQSVHVNLPFGDDDEFGRLHAAIRVVLPILPALAASSPIMEGRATGLLDSRLEAYRTNSARIPSVTGAVIPEPVFARETYEREIYQPMMRDIAPYDPAGVLEQEFLNARGAIARFDRDAIEIRVLDVQEHSRADLAIAALVARTLSALVDERWASQEAIRAWPVAPLAALLREGIRAADAAEITDARFLALFGFPGERATAGELWRHLASALFPEGFGVFEAPLRAILERGPLARRILRALGEAPTKDRIGDVYRELADCLGEGRSFG